MKINEFRGKHYFLSNFYPSPIEMGGVVYPTVEHAYQAQKTLDLEMRMAVAMLDTPGQAKRAGQKLELREDWDDVKLDFMEQCLRIKFAHADLRDRLQMTQGCELAEGNTWGDTFWGICNHKGRNELGKLLMKIRDED